MRGSTTAAVAARAGASPATLYPALLQDMAFALSGEGGLLMRAPIGEAAHNTVLAETLATAFLTPVRRRS